MLVEVTNISLNVLIFLVKEGFSSNINLAMPDQYERFIIYRIQLKLKQSNKYSFCVDWRN